jgi:putative ABC transport system permease protein
MIRLNYITILVKQICSEMLTRKLRSFLAIFCIAWGTITVVLLLALSNGFEFASKKNMMNVVDNAFFVLPSKTSKQYRGLPKGRRIFIKSDDVMDIPKNLPDVEAATPFMFDTHDVAYHNKQIQKEIYGVSADFINLRKLSLEKNSRFFSQQECNKSSRVAIIGNKLKDNIFGTNSALGKNIVIDDIQYTIIGTVEKPGRNTDNRYDDAVIIPYKTFVTNWGDVNLKFFIVVAKSNIDPYLMQVSLIKYLSFKYRFDITDKTAVQIYSSYKISQFISWFLIGIKIFLGICGTLTLGVGSLGTANIMFLIVTERTREIGLRKALGARNWHILLQILLETLIIIVLGGAIGFLISILITSILQVISLPDWLGVPSISGTVVFTVILILGTLGLLSGYFPARRAAKMDPVVALMR